MAEDGSGNTERGENVVTRPCTARVSQDVRGPIYTADPEDGTVWLLSDDRTTWIRVAGPGATSFEAPGRPRIVLLDGAWVFGE